ncbi:MAG: methyltransferase domain-containing protein [Saprospiraceae bacterium]|nr:methyltransferase domain-containing protein [Saprospiraceae bacterium]
MAMKQAEAAAAFDRLAVQYDAWYTTPLGAFVNAREQALLFELTKVRPGEQALDVGCGTGNYTLALAQRGIQAMGVDLSPAMLAVAISKAKEARVLQPNIQ